MTELTGPEHRILEYLAGQNTIAGVTSDDLARVLPIYGSEADLCIAVERLRREGLVVTHINSQAAYPRYDLVMITEAGRTLVRPPQSNG